MNILHVAYKDLQILIRERGRLVMTFALPLIFIIAFSAAFAQSDTGESTMPLPVVNLDPGGTVTQALIDGLDQGGVVRVDLYGEGEAQALLEEGQADQVLTIPAGFSADVAAGRQAGLRLVTGRDPDDSAVEAARQAIAAVTDRLALQVRLLAAAQRIGEVMPGAPEEAQRAMAEQATAQMQAQFERAQSEPLIGVESRLPEAITREHDFNPTDVSVPGFMVLFVFLAAGSTAMAIYSEKKLGSYRRLLVAPLGRGELLVGKMIPNLVLILVQIAVILVAARFLLPLGGLSPLSLGRSPLALIVLSVMVALCATGLGVLLAAIARTESQISGIGTVALWVMGAVSGAFIPRFFLGDLLGAVGRFVPHYWAAGAYVDLFVRNQGLAGIMPELAVLAGFTLLFFGVGLSKFRFE
ncbi:MAG: ABC transporter permease [Anaerolineae bacterium]|nr:ABC transporter permease [Anaerolineae bacterium]